MRRRSKSREGKKARLKRSKSSGAVHVKKEAFRHIRERPRTQSRAAGGRPQAQRRRRAEPSLAEFKAMSPQDQAAYRASLVPRRPMSAHASQSMKRELASTGTGHVQDSTHAFETKLLREPIEGGGQDVGPSLLDIKQEPRYEEAAERIRAGGLGATADVSQYHEAQATRADMLAGDPLMQMGAVPVPIGGHTRQDPIDLETIGAGPTTVPTVATAPAEVTAETGPQMPTLETEAEAGVPPLEEATLDHTNDPVHSGAVDRLDKVEQSLSPNEIIASTPALHMDSTIGTSERSHQAAASRDLERTADRHYSRQNEQNQAREAREMARMRSETAATLQQGAQQAGLRARDVRVEQEVGDAERERFLAGGITEHYKEAAKKAEDERLRLRGGASLAASGGIPSAQMHAPAAGAEDVMHNVQQQQRAISNAAAWQASNFNVAQQHGGQGGAVVNVPPAGTSQPRHPISAAPAHFGAAVAGGDPAATMPGLDDPSLGGASVERARVLLGRLGVSVGDEKQQDLPGSGGMAATGAGASQGDNPRQIAENQAQNARARRLYQMRKKNQDMNRALDASMGELGPLDLMSPEQVAENKRANDRIRRTVQMRRRNALENERLKWEESNRQHQVLSPRGGGVDIAFDPQKTKPAPPPVPPLPPFSPTKKRPKSPLSPWGDPPKKRVSDSPPIKRVSESPPIKRIKTPMSLDPDEEALYEPHWVGPEPQPGPGPLPPARPPRAPTERSWQTTTIGTLIGPPSDTGTSTTDTRSTLPSDVSMGFQPISPAPGPAPHGGDPRRPIPRRVRFRPPGGPGPGYPGPGGPGGGGYGGGYGGAGGGVGQQGGYQQQGPPQQQQAPVTVVTKGGAGASASSASPGQAAARPPIIVQQKAAPKKKKAVKKAQTGVTQARKRYTAKRKQKLAELRSAKAKKIREFNAKTKTLPKAERQKRRRDFKQKVNAQLKTITSKFPTARGITNVARLQQLLKQVNSMRAN